MWLTKTAQSCLPHHKIPSHFGCDLRAENPIPTRNSLLDPTRGQDTSFQEDLYKTCWDCATSHPFFLLESPCPAICHAGQENNLFWAWRAPAWQGQRGQAQGEKQAQEFSDIGSACLMTPPELVFNLSFLYLTLGELLSADRLRHKISPNMGILLGEGSSLKTSLLNSSFFC